jgi:hypothetical protein
LRVTILTFIGYTEAVFCLAALVFLVVKRLWGNYWALGSFLAVRLTVNLGLRLLSRNAGQIGMRTAYQFYFYVYWVGFALESVLVLFILYSAFRLTLAPLKGLQKAGSPVFLAASAIGVGVALLPAFSTATSGTRSLIAAISQLQRGQSLLTLGMLAFVFLAVRFAGVSGASKIFGVSLGLGIMAINDLAQSRWLAFHPNARLAYSVINGTVICAILLLWTAYLAWPEPERGEIDSRSPLLRWDRICQGWFA